MSEGSCDAEDWVMMLKAQSHPKTSYMTINIRLFRRDTF